MSILVALWLTLKAPGRNWHMRANCKMASSLLWALRLLSFARPKPWISSVLGGPFCVPVPQSEIYILEKKEKNEISWRGGDLRWRDFFCDSNLGIGNLLICGLIYCFQCVCFLLCSERTIQVTESQKDKDVWHMSAWRRAGEYAECTGKRGQLGLGGLAAAPHLPRVSGCGQHPITHPYHFAKPAPLSLDMWHEGHSAKWNLQVNHVLL